MTAPAAAPIAASRLVFFWVYVPPDDVEPVDPADEEPELPDDELVVRRGALVVRRGAALDGAGATSAGA